MNNHIHELSSDDLEEVSGGLRNFPTQPVPPNAPVLPPPVYGPGPWVPPGHGQFFVNGPGVFEL
jgi:hypothetical protein